MCAVYKLYLYLTPHDRDHLVQSAQFQRNNEVEQGRKSVGLRRGAPASVPMRRSYAAQLYAAQQVASAITGRTSGIPSLHYPRP